MHRYDGSLGGRAAIGRSVSAGAHDRNAKTGQVMKQCAAR